jgi:hypothetical protein
MSKKNLPTHLLSVLQKLSPKMIFVLMILCELMLLIPLLSLLNKKEKPNQPKELDTSTNSFTNTSGGQSRELFSEDRTLVKQRLPIISTNPGSDGAKHPLYSDRTFVTKLPALPPGITAQKSENLPPIPLPVPSPSRLPLPPAPTSTPVPSAPSLSTPSAKNNPVKDNTNSPTQKKTTPPASATPKVNSANAKKYMTNSPQKPQNRTSKPADSKTLQPKASPSPTTTPTTILTEEKLLDDIFAKLETEIEFTEDLNFSQPEKFVGSISGLKKIIGIVVDKNPQELALILKKQLEANDFQVSQINTYADGFVYEVKKAKFTEYITLTPDIETKGTIIVTWINPPTDSI